MVTLARFKGNKKNGNETLKARPALSSDTGWQYIGLMSQYYALKKLLRILGNTQKGTHFLWYFP